MSHTKLSVAGIVIILLVAATTLLLGALAVIGYSSYRSRQQADFARQHAVIADQLATSLTLPVWNFDREQVGKVMESAMQDDDIYGVVARSTGDLPIQYVRARNDDWKVIASTGTLATSGLQIEKRPIAVAGETIGEVEVFATPRFLEARLRQTLFAIIGIIGFLDLILVLGLSLLLWHTVLKPLKELEKHALAVSQGSHFGESLPRKPYLGELESLRGSLAKMIGMLEMRFQDVQRSEARFRQLAETLRESEEKFAKAFRSSPQPITITDLETGRIIEANEGFLRTYGFTRDETIGHTTLELGIWVNLADRQRVADALRERASLRNVKVPGRTRRGEIITTLMSCELITLGDRPCFLAIMDDITAQERAETALRESEEKFSKAFRDSPNPIVISERDSGRIIDANATFLHAIGATAEQVIGRSSVELGLWHLPAERETLGRAIQSNGSVRNFKVHGLTLRGAPLVVLVSAVLIELREKTALLTMMQDITDHERAEIALRESEEKFSTAFRSGPDAMAIAEMETGRYLDVNDGFERLWGYTRKEALGRTSLELGMWPEAAERESFLATLRTHGAVRDLECVSRNRHGDSITFLISAEEVELGGRRCILSVSHDITDRQRAIARERQAREEFTQRLIASQEAERRRIAGELHDSLGQNLLLIKNRAQLALATAPVPPEFRWQLESIQDMAAQSIAEVRQISHDLRPYQLDQLGLTRALESMIDAAARNTGFQFTRKLEFVDDVFAPEAATNLYRVVQESLSNILHHARASHARITLERDVRHVRLEITDDGRGFTPGAPLPVPHKEGGFGLKNIAERVRILGGVLQIDSAPDRGTRLAATIPLPEDT